MVYVAFGSHSDARDYHGWFIAHQSSNLPQQTAVFNTTPNGTGGGIWQSGHAPMIDSAGSVFVVSGAAYVYNYFGQNGRLVPANGGFSDSVGPNGPYYVIAPVGQSGIARVGDAGKFFSAGQQRISLMEDDGILSASVRFAPGEESTRIWGYSPTEPVVTVTQGSVTQVTYNAASQVFMIVIGPAPGEHTASLSLYR
jgi:hypothetical protein